jgi:hypothetical protein
MSLISYPLNLFYEACYGAKQGIFKRPEFQYHKIFNLKHSEAEAHLLILVARFH